MGKLDIELVPKSMWYLNLRKILSKEQWNNVKRKCFKKANGICEVCGDNGLNQGYNYRVACHEIWEYDDTNHIQTLKGFIALCPECHQVKHIGYAQVSGHFEQACDHFMKVNQYTAETAALLIKKAFVRYQERSKYKYKLDLSYYNTYIGK